MSMGNGAWRWIEPQDISRGDCAGYPWQPVSRNHQALSHWISVKTIKYLPYTYHAKRDGQEKPGCKYVSPCMQAPANPHTNP